MDGDISPSADWPAGCGPSNRTRIQPLILFHSAAAADAKPATFPLRRIEARRHAAHRPSRSESELRTLYTPQQIRPCASMDEYLDNCRLLVIVSSICCLLSLFQSIDTSTSRALCCGSVVTTADDLRSWMTAGPVLGRTWVRRCASTDSTCIRREKCSVFFARGSAPSDSRPSLPIGMSCCTSSVIPQTRSHVIAGVSFTFPTNISNSTQPHDKAEAFYVG